jgi:hypothetical protein
MNCSKALRELVAESPWPTSVIIKEMFEKNKCFPGFQKLSEDSFYK